MGLRLDGSGIPEFHGKHLTCKFPAEQAGNKSDQQSGDDSAFPDSIQSAGKQKGENAGNHCE